MFYSKLNDSAVLYLLTFLLNVPCCQVLSLEAANLKLEQKIKEFYESRTLICSKASDRKYYSIIEDLEKQVKQQPTAIIKLSKFIQSS